MDESLRSGPTFLAFAGWEPVVDTEDEVIFESTTVEEYDALNRKRVEDLKEHGRRVIRSKWGGQCHLCGARFRENDRIIWRPGAPRGRSVICFDTIACQIREYERGM